MEELIDKLPTFGIGGKSLVTIIIALSLLWTIRECFRLKYGRDSTALGLTKHFALLLKVFLREIKSDDRAQKINFLMVTFLLFVFVVFVFVSFFPPKILRDSYPKIAAIILLSTFVITPLAAISSTAFVLRQKAWEDAKID